MTLRGHFLALLDRLTRWAAPPTSPGRPPARSSIPPEEPRAGVSDAAVQNAMIPPPRPARGSLFTTVQDVRKLFAPYKPPPGTIPPGAPELAMDDASSWGATEDWARGGLASVASAEGQAFVGFPTLAILSQRGEYRIISETIADEMVRKWITIKALDGSDKSKEIAEINKEFERLGVREAFHEVGLQDGFFGRAHLFLDFGDVDDDAELKTPIGDGTDEAENKAKIGKGSLKAIRVIEPMWIYPQNYNSSNPLKADWYKPKAWYVYTKTIDATRILTFVARPVPDLLKPSYAFAGLSATQMAIPYVDNWLDVRQGVTDIIKAFVVFVLKTNAADVLAGGSGKTFLNRLDFFNQTRSVRGVLGIDKDKEDFVAVSAPLGTLDHLQAQALEHCCSISQIPLVKYTGISPSGLNASSEGELQVFADLISSRQEKFYRPNLMTLLRIVQLSLFGKVDHQIGIEFGELVEMTLQEEADLRKTDAETGEILVRAKAISSEEERARAIKDLKGPYQDLDPGAKVAFPMTENEKADVAAKVATTASTLVAENIIGIPVALREIRAQTDVTGFGEFITDEMISEAEEDEANAPDPGELVGGDPGADPELAKMGEPGKPAPSAAGARPKSPTRAIRPPETVGSKPIA